MASGVHRKEPRGAWLGAQLPTGLKDTIALNRMSIIVTPGETALLAAFEQAGVQITTRNLLVGDIHICKGDSPVYIFERKAKGDLDASIKDKRYREQKSRLIETGLPRKNIVYIIEALSKPRDSAGHKRVWSAICNSQHRDGFCVFQTKNTAETVEYLVAMARSIEQFESLEDSKCSEDVTVNIKKRQVSTDDWFKYSLTLIPRCSLGIATVITDEYPTMSSLVENITEKGNECLKDLKYGSSKRRIGAKLSVEICETVLNNY